MENYNRVEEYEYVKYYFLNDKLHRLDGPAIVYDDGSELWYKNSKLHRLDGPAIERSNGDKVWYKNGLCHRLNGPAIEHTNGYKEWWIEGKKIECDSQEEFERLIKLKLFW
jgi:hypothetical protein